MLTLVLNESIEKSKEVISKYQEIVGAFEIRLDLMEITIDELHEIRAISKKPLILTLRMESHGGKFKGSFDDKYKVIKSYSIAGASYVDFEKETPNHLINQFKNEFPSIKVIRSSHIFFRPRCIEKEMKSLINRGGDIFKLCFNSTHLFDNFQLIELAKKLHKQKKAFILIMMGPRGQLSRALLHKYGNYFTFCSKSLDLSAKKLGHFSIEDLSTLYRINSIKKTTPVYALLGDPVEKSPSNFTHNQLFSIIKNDSIYLKINVKKEELFRFLKKSKNYYFKGFSITAPLKEEVAKLVYLRHKVDSINTLKLERNEWIGINTDQYGVVDCLEGLLDLKMAKILIIGAGGFAKGISNLLHQRGSSLYFTNRSKEKALYLCKLYRGNCIDFHEPNGLENLDVIIQATSAELSNIDISFSRFLQSSKLICFESIITPQKTMFVKQALNHGCSVIYGYELFLAQGSRQIELWIHKGDRKNYFNLIKESYLNLFSSSSFLREDETSIQNTLS